MNKHHQIRNSRAQVRRRKEWIANATVLAFIAALAGCQNAQRWSQPSATPSDGYFTPSSTSAAAPATGPTITTSAATGEAPTWNATSGATNEYANPSAPPRYVTTAYRWSGDVGSPDGTGAGAVAGGDGLGDR